MEEENKNAYSEVIEVLKLVDDEKKLEKLPIEMLEVLKSKANQGYKPVISKEIPLDEQNLQPETYSILSWIAMKYWSEEVEEDKEKISEDRIEENKEEILNEQNELQENKETNGKQITTENIDEKQENMLPILHKELKWYEVIKNKIVELFRRLFKKDKTND